MSTHDAGTRLDQIYRHVTEPLARQVARLSWVTPDRVSLAAFACGGVAAPILIACKKLRAAGVAYILSDLLDYLDGDVARAQGTASARGDVLDGVLDRYTDVLCVGTMSLFVTGLLGDDRPAAALLGPPGPRVGSVVGLAAIIGSLMPSYVQALAVANDRPTVQSIGGRGTRNRVIFTGLLAEEPFWTLVAIAVLSNIASVHRIAHVLGRHEAPAARVGGGDQRGSRQADRAGRD
jgi:CDP-diacylglycerol--glycerol-3-phosphate 3-phosphatidyltransferase/archaetidylinositol phosphate synthase